jgi:DNA polymerase-3 subunit beta
MKFKINREQFLKGLLVASKPTTTKSPIPVLGNILMTLDEKGLHLLGSNGELAIKTLIPIRVNDMEVIRIYSEGACLISSKIIVEMIRKLEGNEIDFELFDGSIAKIEDGRTKYNLNSVRPDEYPEIDLDKTGVTFEVECKKFVKMVDQTSFAASTKEQRPILTAIHLEASEGELTAIATDSARLAKKTIEIKDNVVFAANIPARVLQEIAKTIEGTPGVSLVEITVSDKKVLFEFDGTIVSSRLIAGDYPNTKNIIPKSYNSFLEVNANELLKAMERVALLAANERENIVKLSLSENGVVVSSRSPLSGSATETISTCKYSGEALDISFNHLFVSAAVKACQSEDVIIGFLGEMKPFSVRVNEDPAHVQIVTPVRTY